MLPSPTSNRSLMCISRKKSWWRTYTHLEAFEPRNYLYCQATLPFWRDLTNNHENIVTNIQDAINFNGNIREVKTWREI